MSIYLLKDVPHIIFRALCDIDEGAKLLYDYDDRHIGGERLMLVNLDNFA